MPLSLIDVSLSTIILLGSSFIQPLIPSLWRRVVTGRGITQLAELPWASKLHIFPYKTWRAVYMGNKKSAPLEGWPTLLGPFYFDGRVTLLAGPTFLIIFSPGQPVRQSELAQVLLAREKGSTFFSYLISRLGGWSFDTGQVFLI